MNPRVLNGIATLCVAAWILAATAMLSMPSLGIRLSLLAAAIGIGHLVLARRAGPLAPPTERGPAPIGVFALGGLTLALLAAALYAIFVVAPVELQMGIVQKIFYFHVPSAYAMYVGFTLATIGSVGFLWKRKPRWDALAVAGAEVGLLFCAIVMITGPLWARKAWGVYWTWDPRLTTTMLAGLIFTAFVVLRSFGGAGEAERRFASALSIVGFFLLPVIHYSVQRWRGQHPTVITREGGGLHPDMYPALYLSLALFTALVALLVWVRARAEQRAQELAALEVDAATLGLLEES